jgi:hypothetical protein
MLAGADMMKLGYVTIVVYVTTGTRLGRQLWPIPYQKNGPFVHIRVTGDLPNPTHALASHNCHAPRAPTPHPPRTRCTYPMHTPPSDPSHGGVVLMGG